MNRLIFRDAPLRTALELYFRTVGITNYVIDNKVMGLVTGNATVTAEAFPKALFPSVTYEVTNEIWMVLKATQDERFDAFRQNKLTCPSIFGEPRRVAGIALRSQGGPLAIVEQGSPPQSEVRIVARGDHFGEAQVSAITEQGLVLAERAQRLAIPLTGLVPRPAGAPTAVPGLERAVLADAPLSSVLELIVKAGGPQLLFEGTPEGYVSGETASNVILLLMQSSNVPLTYTKENGGWHVRTRGRGQPTPPRFVSLEEVRQGRVQLPLVAGAPRRVAGVLLGERSWALLETSSPLGLQRMILSEGEPFESFRVSRIDRTGVVLKKDERSFLVPLVPLNPLL